MKISKKTSFLRPTLRISPVVASSCWHTPLGIQKIARNRKLLSLRHVLGRIFLVHFFPRMDKLFGQVKNDTKTPLKTLKNSSNFSLVIILGVS